MSQYLVGDPKREDELNELREEQQIQERFGLQSRFDVGIRALAECRKNGHAPISVGEIIWRMGIIADVHLGKPDCSRLEWLRG